MYDVDAGLELCGGMGRYQIRQLVLSFLMVMLAASQNLSVVFTTISPKFSCGDDQMISTAVNGSMNHSPSTDEVCKRFVNSNCSGLTFDKSVMDVTLVTKYHLVCDRSYLVYLISTLYMIGFFFGSTIFGYISDKFGRIQAIVAAGIQTLVFAIIAAFVPLLSVYMVARVIVALGASGVLNAAITYMTEGVTSKYRALTVVILSVPWPLSFLTLNLITYLLRNQTYIELAISALCLSIALLFFFCHESPRWLLVVGQKEKAIKVLKCIAEANRINLHVKDLEIICTDAHLSQSSVKEKEDEKGIMSTFFILPRMRLISVVVWYLFFSVSMLFYGLSYGVTALKGWSIFAQVAFGAGIEMIFILSLIPLMHRLARISLTIIGFGLVSAMSFTVTGLQNGGQSLQIVVTVLCCLARAISSFNFNVLTLYCVEVYPTTHRNIGAGLASASARLGAIVASQLVSLGRLWSPAPYLVYSIIALSVSFLLFMMPETKGQTSLDTMTEAEEFAGNPFYRQLIRKCLSQSDGNADVGRSSRSSVNDTFELKS